MFDFRRFLSLFPDHLEPGIILQFIFNEEFGIEFSFSDSSALLLNSLDPFKIYQAQSGYNHNPVYYLSRIRRPYQSHEEVMNDFTAYTVQQFRSAMAKIPAEYREEKPIEISDTVDLVTHVESKIKPLTPKQPRKDTPINESLNSDEIQTPSLHDEVEHGISIGKYHPVEANKIHSRYRRFYKRRDVHMLSEAMINNMGFYLDDLVYAPPASGKSTVNKGTFYNDSDHLYHWFMGAKNCVTNLHSMIRCAATSIAIIPDRKTFETRCKSRGLVYADSWYDDMIENCKGATCVVLSNRYLSEIIQKANGKFIVNADISDDDSDWNFNEGLVTTGERLHIYDL